MYLTAAPYSDPAIPVQVSSVDHHPKPSAHKLIFRLLMPLGINMCVSDIHHMYYLHIYI